MQQLDDDVANQLP
jgi:hypothetical protein